MGVVALALLFAPATAGAQPAPAATTATQPAATQPAATQPAATQTTAAPAAGTQAAAQPADAKPDALAAALSKQPGGMTLDEVARLALKTRPSLRAKQAELKAAAAKVDQAFVSYFPRLSASFTYTRLSDVTNTLGNGSLLATQGVSGPVATTSGPCLDDDTKMCTYVTNSQGQTGPLVATQLNIPVVLDNYNFTASIAVPVSDYVLRISQGFSAASHAEKGKKIELEAETLTAAVDAKVAYLNWLRAKGSALVGKEAVAVANAHVDDVKRLKVVGLASQADVLRGEAQVAAAQQAAVELEAFQSIAEEQVRIGLGLPKDKTLVVGVDVFGVAPPANIPDLAAAQSQALEKRLEIRALDETELSLKEVESVTRAGYYPRVDAFADLTVANPNQRYPFAGDQWNTTWDAGVRVSWTFNDTFTTIGAAAESKARVTQIAENKKQLKDGLRLEVAAAWAEIKKSGASIDAATRGLTAAEESLRVRRELFLQGKATNVEMLDAETEVIRAKLRKLDAQIGLLVNQTKFDHAVGNDVGTVKPADPQPSGDEASAKKITDVAKADPPKATPAPLLPLK